MNKTELGPMNIRLYASEDLKDLYRLFALPEMDGDSIPEINVFEQTIQELNSLPNYSIYLAELDGKVVGTFGLTLVKHLSHQGATSAIVKDVIVDTDYRNQKIGRKMMEFAAEHCKALGCYYITLSSHKNRSGAHRFYEGLDYEFHGNSYLLELNQNKF